MKTSLIILFFAIVFFGVGYYSGKKVDHLLKVGKRTTATIIGHKDSSTSQDTSYCPVVNFTNEQGEVVERTVNPCEDIPPTEGTQVEIIYDPNDPDNTEMYPPTNGRIMSVVFLCIGFFCVVLAGWEFYKTKRV